MAAVPQQEPAKPAKRRDAPMWRVFEVVRQASGDGEAMTLHAVSSYEARKAESACWRAAEGPLREKCMSDAPPELVAIKASEVDPKPYRLRSTVERVKA